MILCLDLGTNMGWACGDDDPANTTSGTVEFKNDRFSGGGMRFLRMKQWLTQMLALQDALEAVYFEEVRRHVSTDSSHIYGGFMGILTSWCEQRSIPYSGVPVGTIKRAVTGKGNSDKKAMVEWAQGAGYHPKDDNEADALALLHHARAKHYTEAVTA